MIGVLSLPAVSEFWGGDGRTWLAILAIVVLVLLSGLALYHARTFVKKI